MGEIFKTRKLSPGEKYARLTVVKYDPARKSWLCQCDCGNTSFSRPSILKNGSHKSCGCLRDEETAARLLKPDFLSYKKRIYKQYKDNAKARVYVFELSLEEVSTLISKDCFYCGASPTTPIFAPKLYKLTDVSALKANGIDRVDNSKGYELGNCVPCCKTCNAAKSDKSYDEWIAWIHQLIKFQTKS